MACGRADAEASERGIGEREHGAAQSLARPRWIRIIRGNRLAALGAVLERELDSAGKFPVHGEEAPPPRSAAVVAANGSRTSCYLSSGANR